MAVFAHYSFFYFFIVYNVYNLIFYRRNAETQNFFKLDYFLIIVLEPRIHTNLHE
jgi:hypothetical protein